MDMRTDAAGGKTRPIKASAGPPLAAWAGQPTPPADPGPRTADRLAPTEGWHQEYMDDRQKVASMIAAVASARSKHAAESYAPQSVNQSPVSGGGPAVEPDQMSPQVINSSPSLKFLYSNFVQTRAPWMLDVYKFATRVTGPVGAFVSLGFNLWNAKKLLSDPKSPAFIKGGIVGSTALAGVSAATATRLSLAAFKVLPMADTAMSALGKVAGVTGLGAGAILAGINTYNTFSNPKSTAAQKGFSVTTTAASVALTIVTASSIGGPLGAGLGIGLAAVAVGAMFAQSFLAHNKIANQVFSTVGKGFEAGARGLVRGAKAVGGAVAGAARAVGHVAGSIGHGLSSAADAVGGTLSHVFSGW